ncbi:hypothetical protein BSPA14S_K0039 (plasmid) [Borreliella spielmanii A14S]|uniref:Uncharacterized protein n=1 Tax=Borreliella spielmanii A14S TaxID=498742 RepID=C0RBN2_9SPIR|nr:hypothetical protein BSPA14S_N0005 [Borreliella spielmanii A14S]ACN53224.1 hypothetical protein BSPA14S_K0039 [Borreliella spielmanii A14S]
MAFIFQSSCNIPPTPFPTVSSDAKICIVKLKINIKMKIFFILILPPNN